MRTKIWILATTLLFGAAASACAQGEAPPGTGGTGGAGNSTGGTGGADVIACGNGKVEEGEACDDLGTEPGDGCDASCAIEMGWACNGAPSVCTPDCGDGMITGSEACDDGNVAVGDGCSDVCAIEKGFDCTGTPSDCSTTCGDGKIGGAEECDDKNTAAGDGCDASCLPEVGYDCPGEPSKCVTPCGDGIIAGAETCDDGDSSSGDGCDHDCQLEPGWNCDGMPTVCTSACGNGIVTPDEACDDGNTDPDDGCDAMCAKEAGWSCNAAMPTVCTSICGDGLIVGLEECDDDNILPGDGCSGQCKVLYGYECTGEPSVCAIKCGDGILAGAEACDDGDNDDGDGCSSACTVEMGWTCQGIPSLCAPACGDSKLVGNEPCDDGNLLQGDGCSPGCTVEVGYHCSGQPSVCVTICGDGEVGGTEQCDDGSISGGDGCANCAVESGYSCTGVAPSMCAPTCGDGLILPGEQCDDSNTLDGDCCSSACKFESGCEIEANNTAATANDFAVVGSGGKVKAIITPGSDQDYFKVVIPPNAASGSINAITLDGPLAGDTCASLKLDTYITIYNSALAILAFNDDTGTWCSNATASNLAPGTYYVAVKNSSFSPNNTYTYTLQINLTLAICGNGVKNLGEQCDDNNNVNNDGCSSTCKIESMLQELEPNDTFAQADANALAAQPVLLNTSKTLGGAITPGTDKDIFKVTLAQARAVRFETFDTVNPSDCLSGGQPRIRLFNSAQTQLYLDSAFSGIANCSALVVFLNAGTYYVQVDSANSTAIPLYFLEMSIQTDGGSESEPNATTVEADVFPGVETYVFGGHQTNVDSDYFSFVVPQGKSIRAELIEGSAAETCESNGIDSRLTLYDSNGIQMADDDNLGRGNCSEIDGTGSVPVHANAHNLAADTYYLQVRASTAAQAGVNGQFDYRLVVTIR